MMNWLKNMIVLIQRNIIFKKKKKRKILIKGTPDTSNFTETLRI